MLKVHTHKGKSTHIRTRAGIHKIIHDIKGVLLFYLFYLFLCLFVFVCFVVCFVLD